MNQWLKRFRNAVLLGLAWAVVWAPVAVLVGVFFIDPDNSMDEMWPAIGAYPGFLCALLFSAIIGMAERGRTLAELSMPVSAVGGAVSGVVVGALPLAISTPSPEHPLWQTLTIGGAFMLMSAISAIGSVLLARMARNRDLRGARATSA